MVCFVASPYELTYKLLFAYYFHKLIRFSTPHTCQSPKKNTTMGQKSALYLHMLNMNEKIHNKNDLFKTKTDMNLEDMN